MLAVRSDSPRCDDNAVKFWRRIVRNGSFEISNVRPQPFNAQHLVPAIHINNGHIGRCCGKCFLTARVSETASPWGPESRYQRVDVCWWESHRNQREETLTSDTGPEHLLVTEWVVFLWRCFFFNWTIGSRLTTQ